MRQSSIVLIRQCTAQTDTKTVSFALSSLSLSLSLPVVGDNKGPHCPCIARKISTLLPIPGGTLRVAQTLAGDSRPKRNETTEHRVVPLSRSESIGSDICGLREVRGGGGEAVHASNTRRAVGGHVTC